MATQGRALGRRYKCAPLDARFRCEFRLWRTIKAEILVEGGIP